VAEWRVVRRWTFEGPGEAGADIEGGHAFALEHTATGAERQLSIEIAAGGPGVSRLRVEEVLRSYLDWDDPPRRVILDRQGNLGRAVRHD
jgi:hypothetical protein